MFQFAGLTALALVVSTTGLIAEQRPKKRDKGDPTITKLLKLHNAERARQGYKPLKLDRKMCIDAKRHAEWMADTGWYQHSELPYNEIIHSGPTTAEEAVEGWIYSPSHHWLMLSGTRAGFGYVLDKRGAYWVGVFR